MEKWKTIILYALAAVALLAVSFVYSRRLGEELISQAEADELASIPVREEAEV